MQEYKTSNNQFEKRQAYQKRFDSLKQEHQVRVPAYQDLSRYINPTRGIFNNDRTKIGKMIDHRTLLSSYATHAQRTFASGMNSGMTNKSNEWFRPTLSDMQYIEIPGVREWLDKLKTIMYDILNQSNIYGVFYSSYEELGQFGPACFLILEDYDHVIRSRNFTAGEYYLSIDNKGRVNGFAREFEMTPLQMINEFGLESCSQSVQNYAKTNNTTVKIKINHLIEENSTRDPFMVDYKNMPYKSCYWESGNQEKGFLAERGFKRFPVVAPRWDVITTDDVYGYGPGWHALGAIKELQKTRKDKLLAQEKLHNPPMIQDGAVNGHVNLLPGGVTKSSSNVPNTGVRPAYQINPAIDSFVAAMAELKEEIDRFFFVNLFLMLLNVDRTNMTATEVAERQQEKIMMMGPALHRLDEEMLTPTLEILFGIMEDNGLIPEAPPQIQGLGIKIEYTSILAQAQKALGVNKIEKVIGFVGNAIALGFVNALDNIDIDVAIREVSNMEGAPAKIIKKIEEMQAERQQRAQQQQMAMAMEAADVGGKTVKNLATAPMGQDSALDRVMPSAG